MLQNSLDSSVTYLIYGLVDPSTLLVRYVGLSTSGMTRPNSHRHTRELKKPGHKASWIKSLLAVGLDYTIVVLEEVTTKDALGSAECFWIAYGRACNWPLTNLSDGGPGNIGWRAPPETRARMSAAAKGKPKSAEHALNAGMARRGAKMPLWLMEKLRTINTGRPLSAEHREKVGASSRGRKHSPETLAKMRASQGSPEARARKAANATTQWAKRSK